MELVDKTDLMQVPFLNLFCPFEQAIQWSNYTGTFVAEFASLVIVSLLYSYNEISITRIKHSLYIFCVFSCPSQLPCTSEDE